MYFVRSGYITLSEGLLRNASATSNSWNSTALPSSPRSTFYLYFSSTNLLLSNNNDRNAGFSLRLLSSLIYFVRSGYIALPYGSLRNADSTGVFWSSVAYPANSQLAFDLNFHSTNAYPSNGDNRYTGFSLAKHPYSSLMYFVRSGVINLPDAALRHASSLSLVWSSTAFNTISHTLSLFFNHATTEPSANIYRWSAFSLHSSKNSIHTERQKILISSEISIFELSTPNVIKQ